jgi:hypothetical protein
MSLTLPPNHRLFEDLGIDFGDATEVEVCLGANPACARHLSGAGIPCVLYPRNPDGTVQGTGAHAGFVAEFDFHALTEAGADEDALWFALDARKGLYLDEDDEPVCGECVLTAYPDARLEGQEGDWEEDEDEPDGYRGQLYRLLPADKQGPCHCCCQMISESMEASAQAAAEAEGES